MIFHFFSGQGQGHLKVKVTYTTLCGKVLVKQNFVKFDKNTFRNEAIAALSNVLYSVSINIFGHLDPVTLKHKLIQVILIFVRSLIEIHS